MLRFRRLFGNADGTSLPNVDPVQVLSYEETCRAVGKELNRHLEKRGEMHVEVAKSFIPIIIRQSDLCRSRQTVMRRSVGCVVSCVAAGFSNLTEKLAPRADGAEVMSRCLNRFFTPLIDIIEAYRGDIIKFGGDTISIFFEATDDYIVHTHPCGSFGQERKTPLQLACLRATACSLEIHRRMDAFETGEHIGVKLRIQTSIGAGNVALLQVGGGHGLDRFEFIIVGPPMEQLSNAISLAGEGDTIVSPEAWAEVSFAALEGEPLTDGPEGYRRLNGLDTMLYTYPTVKKAAVECTIKEAQLEHEKRISKSEVESESTGSADEFEIFMRFLPRAVFKHLRSGNTSSINEVRTVTIIMCQVPGVDTFTNVGSEVAQRLMANMQRAIYCNEGNLNKFMVDDRKMIFVIVFGLPPMVHIDDPQRAITTCFDSIGVLKEMGLAGQFAVCTGRVFCGIVGSDRRREYAVMGATVNRAKWLMSHAGASSVLIDEATYQRVNADMSCRRLPPLKDRKTGANVKVFAPVLPVVCGIEVGQFSAMTHHRTWFVRKTRIEVHLEDGKRMSAHVPWRASSRLLGGACPILQLTRWRELHKVDAMLNQENNSLFQAGGGFILHGPSGIGKQELGEYLVHKGSRAGVVPVFGTMHRRHNQQWRAVIELVQNCLNLLAHEEFPRADGESNAGSSPQVRESTDSIEMVLRKYFINADRDHLHQALLFLGFDMFKAEKTEVAVEKCAQPLNILDPRSSVRSVVSRVSASHRFVDSDYSDEDLAEDTAEVASVLVEALADKFGVMVLLRIRHGTDIKDSLGDKSSSFWELAGQLNDLAMKRRKAIIGGVKLKPIVCLTLTRRYPEKKAGEVIRAIPSRRASRTSKITIAPSRKGSFYFLRQRTTTIDDEDDGTKSKRTNTSAEDEPAAATSKHRSLVTQDGTTSVSSGPFFEANRSTNTSEACVGKTASRVKLSVASEPEKPKRTTFWNRNAIKATKTDETRASTTAVATPAPKPYELEMRPLTEDAAVEFMCLCLGLQTTGGGSLVGRKLREFVSAVSINIPTYIQECLEQLTREDCLKISGGECTIDAEDLDAVNIAEWVNTSVVGGAISQLESLGPAKHHIMKLATILKNPFSPLDLVAVNRTLFGQLPRVLRFHDQVKLLVACQELCAMGLLRKVWFPGSNSQPPDCAPAALPRYTISNFLFRRVTRSMVPKSEMLFIKRAVLVNRFIYKGLWIEAPRRLMRLESQQFIVGGQPGKSGTQKNVAVPMTERWVRPWWVFTLMGATRAEHTDKDNMSAEESIERPKLTGIPFLRVRRAASQKPPNSKEVMDILTSACAIGNISVVREILNYHQGLVDLNAGDLNGYTPLHFACSAGHRDICELLCRSRATINAKSSLMETPVLIAAQRGHLKVVQYFITQHPECTTGRENVFAYWEGQLPDMASIDEIPPPLSPDFQDLLAPPKSEEEKVAIEDMSRRRDEVREYFENVNFIKQDGFAEPYISVKSSRHSQHTLEKSESMASKSTVGGRMQQSFAQTMRNSLQPLARASQLTTVTLTRMSAVMRESFLSSFTQAKSFQTTVSVKRKRFHNRILVARVRGMIYSREVISVMLVVVMTALYLPDLCIIAGAENDGVKDFLMTLVTLLFLLELVMISIVDSSYPFSIFFFTDCIGTLSTFWDISYLFGSSASESIKIEANDRDLTFFRALRSGKLGARASRLSRIVKVMRFIPGLKFVRKDESQEGKEQLKQISKQLTNVLSTRLACLTVILIICTPLFSIGLYPENDNGMRAWVEALSRHAQVLVNQGVAFRSVLEEASMETMMDSFTRFYQASSYGPFQFCVSQVCEELPTPFEQPARRNFQLDVETDLVTCHFDVSNVMRAEANMNLVLISLAIFIMCATCLILNYHAAELAIRPLERMMASIKESAHSIFQLTSAFDYDELQNEEFWEHKQSELETLERVVRKVANFAAASRKKDPFGGFVALSRMRTEDFGVLEMTKEWWKTGGMRKTSSAEFDQFLDQTASSSSVDTRMAREWRLEELGFVYEVVNSWYFNPLELTMDKLEQISAWLIVNNPGSSDYTERQVDVKKLSKFIQCVSEGYGRSPYHNFMHAVDVTHAVYRFGSLMHAERIYSAVNQFCLLIAALAHDIGHFGLNNSFLTETQHELAIRYNDRSPLENMHCCKLFEILSVESTNVCLSMPAEDFKDARKLIIDAILHTDMYYHPGMLRELELLYEMNSKTFDSTSVELTEAQVEVLKGGDPKKLMTRMLLHGADLSNPSKPWSLAYDWAYRVLDEYFEQGDKEKELGIPVSMLNDRERVNKPNSQVGFIEFVVAPLLVAQVKLIHAWYESALTLEANLQNWQRTWNFESHPDDAEKEKVRARVNKVGNMLAFASNLKGPNGPRMSQLNRESSDLSGDRVEWKQSQAKSTGKRR